jgi:EAL domain-containing protein (putative c-di-GMP-specific phosphodiesterase class I)
MREGVTDAWHAVDRVWAERLRKALRDDRLTLFAQAICEASTRRVTRHELLLRLLADDGSLILPGHFLPSAERCGVILELDCWVVRRAVSLVAQGHPLQVNASVLSLSQPEFLDTLVTALARTGADPSLLVVEITETARLRDADAAVRSAAALARLGCQLALDDFGTGQSNFSYLKAFPARYLKIDREFTSGLLTAGADRHIVAAITGLAAAMGMQTVAEGVEDACTLQHLTAAGVDHVQGYLLHRPQPVAEVLHRPAGSAVRSEHLVAVHLP